MKSYPLIIKLVISTIVLAASVANAVESLPYYGSKEFTPHWYERCDSELEEFHQIPSFSFIDQDGGRITEQKVANKIYVASFFFTTCPGICPMIRSKLTKVQEQFADDNSLLILSHSIRPATDTIEVLQAYAEGHGIHSGKWHLLTGEQDSIYSLAKNAYFASEDLGNIENTDDFLHTENLLLIDENRHIRGIYNGLNTTSVNYLMADIETLKTESVTPLNCLQR
jgi:protein SCO1/2